VLRTHKYHADKCSQFRFFFQVLYFGYENYLFFVSAKILRIKSETEASLRNSSSLVSLVGNIARILGVFLRMNRSAHSCKKYKKKLDMVLQRESSLISALNKRDILEAEQPKVSSLTNEKKQTSKFGRGINIRVKKPQSKLHTNFDTESKQDDYDKQNFSSGETDSSNGDESSNDEIGEANRKEIKKRFSSYSDLKSKLLSLPKANKEIGMKDPDPEIQNETEKLRLKIRTYLDERNRLEKHLNATEEERKTLYSDAIVVRM
jgi:hypothetical protein